MEAPFIELSKSFREHLIRASMRGVPELDQVAQMVRSVLRRGGSALFEQEALRAFEVRAKTKAVGRKYFKEFMDENRLRIAELVLSEREL